MPQSLQSFYVDTFQPLHLRARSQRTKQLYATTLGNFKKFLQREPDLGDFTDETVSRFLSWFRALGRSPYTVNKERDNLLCLWRFAARKRVVDCFPDVRPDTEPKRIPQAWSKTELQRLFNACKSQTGWIAGVRACDWWIALHHVAWDSGERITAILSLTWPCIDFENNFVLMPAETRKGGLEDRLYKLSKESVEALKTVRQQQQSERVFHWPHSPTYLWDRYKKILKLAALPTDRKSSFHRLRKSVASHFEAAGGNATTLLGHSARKVTEAYLDPRIVEQPQAVDRLFRIDGAGE